MKKIYLVPNLVTTANLFCGFYAIISTLHHDFLVASWAIIAATVFDMLDGRIARLAKATSQFGVEYDSLSDLLSFGAAPSVLLYEWSLSPFDRLGWVAAFLYLACGAFRLARFNVNTHSIPKNYFQGLPIPMAAGVVATFVIFNHSFGWPSVGDVTAEFPDTLAKFVLLLTFGLSALMVSTVRFPSMKEFNWRSRATFGYLMLGVIAMVLIAVKPEAALFLIGTCYICFSLAWNLGRVILGFSATSKHESTSETPFKK